MPLDDYANELVGQFPGLSILVARNMVNKAWSAIRDATLWSWLTSDGAFAVPNVIFTGSVTTVQGSPSVVGDAAAAAAWLAVALANPPLASPNLGFGRQFRITNGPLYNIIAFDGIDTLTLDRPFLEPSLTAFPTYQIYRAYYSPYSLAPTPTSFLRFLAITNKDFAYTIVGEKLTKNQEILNRRDPQRGAQGDAYNVASYKVDAQGNPVYEFWPHPTNAHPYIAAYISRGTDLTATGVVPAVDLPATVSKLLLTSRAEYETALWAMKNVNRFADLKGINWFGVRKEALTEYNAELVKAQRQDFEIFKTLWISPKGMGFGFPVDARFMQSHDVSFWDGGY